MPVILNRFAAALRVLAFPMLIAAFYGRPLRSVKVLQDLGLRRQDHSHHAGLHARRLLYICEVLTCFNEAQQLVASDLSVAKLRTSEDHRKLNLVPFLEKFDGMPALNL